MEFEKTTLPEKVYLFQGRQVLTCCKWSAIPQPRSSSWALSSARSLQELLVWGWGWWSAGAQLWKEKSQDNSGPVIHLFYITFVKNHCVCVLTLTRNQQEARRRLARQETPHDCLRNDNDKISMVISIIIILIISMVTSLKNHHHDYYTDYQYSYNYHHPDFYQETPHHCLRNFTIGNGLA